MIERFVALHKSEWARLDDLVKLVRSRRLGALSANEIVELGSLYRRSVSHLAIARRDWPSDRITLYLNQLVARAHAMVYRSSAGEWRQAGKFFRSGFPTLFRETSAFTLAAFAIFALAGVAGFFAALLSEEAAGYLVPPGIISGVREQRMWTENIPIPGQLLSSLIMANNIQVSLVAFSGGILFGGLTFFVLAMNGLSIGAVAGLCQAYDLSLRLWSFVAPHGGVELTVVFIASGAGLQLGYALLNPGLLARREALALAARKSVRLLFGCVPLLVVAGIIEGFISPAPLPPVARIAIGIAVTSVLYWYLLRGVANRP